MDARLDSGPRATRLPWWWGLVLGGAGLLCQSPVLWDYVIEGFPTYGKWLFVALWCGLMVLLDLLAISVWMICKRRTWIMFVTSVFGLILLSVVALPVALVLAGIIHGTFGEI